MKRIAILLLALAACREDVAEAPDPVPMTPETLAHYCMMNIAEHPGPKAQIFLTGFPDPIFFAQVRDAFTYLNSAEQDGYVSAFYVNDMAAATWDEPGAENWMPAGAAHYVVGSSRLGGMGAPELVPFSDAARANAFARDHGGEVLAMGDVPAEAFLAPVELNLLPAE